MWKRERLERRQQHEHHHHDGVGRRRWRRRRREQRPARQARDLPETARRHVAGASAGVPVRPSGRGAGERHRHGHDRNRDGNDRDGNDRDGNDRDGTTGTTPRRGFFGGGGRFANNPKLRAAFQACGAQFGFRGGAGGGFRRRLSQAAVTKYVTCVRQHGYNLPKPNFSGKGPVFPANIRNNAKFQAASRACQSLLAPARPSGSGSGSGTSTTAGA